MLSQHKLRVAVVGASGMVGRELIQLLEKRRFPVAELFPCGSGKHSTTISFKGRPLRVRPTKLSQLENMDLVFLSTGEDVSRKLAPPLVHRGVWVLDDSSAFRMDPNVPLVIPEINPQVLSSQRRLIAGPNCSMAALAMGIYPLHKKVGVTAVRAATYQSVSGAGKIAMHDLENEIQAWKKNAGHKKIPAPTALPHTIAFNLFPHIGSFTKGGFTTEEVKIGQELRKIFEAPGLKISVTAVRVPVFRGHSIAAWVETRKKITPTQAESRLRKAEGVVLTPGTRYSMPTEVAGRWPVYVGRVRRGESPQEILLWIVSDNLLKGAALNSVQTAEVLLQKGWLIPRGFSSPMLSQTAH
ncbi:MAG: aspartate-semialdehyde dehydrogenase [Elusimicrobia bacterium]|nr:aspartate-semialdehyde dehydrogenase [Elusimicrobiota bacterium]